MIQLNTVLLLISFYFVELSTLTGWNLGTSQAPFTHTYNYIKGKEIYYWGKNEAVSSAAAITFKTQEFDFLNFHSQYLWQVLESWTR